MYFFSGRIAECDFVGEAMATGNFVADFSQSLPLITAAQTECWYALHTRPKHEKLVSQRLADCGVTTFLPLINEVRRWSDRKKTLQLPLFSGYVFARFVPNRNERLRVLRVEGVLELVGAQREGAPIPDEEIESVRTLVAKDLAWSSYPYLAIGQKVRIRSGALDGVEGILVGRNGDRSLVISVNAIQRSLAVRVEGYQLEPVK